METCTMGGSGSRGEIVIPKQLLELGRVYYRECYRGVQWVHKDSLAQYLQYSRRQLGSLCAVALCCYQDCQKSIGITLRPAQGLERDDVLSLLCMLREPQFGKWLERGGDALSSPSRLLPEPGQVEELGKWVVNSRGYEFCPEHALLVEVDGVKQGS